MIVSEAVRTGENKRYEFLAPELGIWVEYYSTRLLMAYPVFSGISPKRRKLKTSLFILKKYKLLLRIIPADGWFLWLTIL